MPAITFKSNGVAARNLYNYSTRLSGDSSQFAARAKVREKVLKAWPELDEENDDQRPEEKDFTEEQKESARMKRLDKDEREFEITATEQTAFAEGFLKFMKDPTVIDGDKHIVMDLARLVRCRYKFLEKRIAKEDLREFAESDDEIEVDDPTELTPAAPAT